METTISTMHGTARDMTGIDVGSVDLVVTSPPYPMIEMWDEAFAAQDKRIGKCLRADKGHDAFVLMHSLLDEVWEECDRVLKPGGMVCINVGDATRTIGGDFRLYSNHSRVLGTFISRGYAALPDILWRKPTNAPNKFLGSGMLPVGAYVTYEHEYILILRKGARRQFTDPEQVRLRRESAFFWEERNAWFSDVWCDIKGTSQVLTDRAARKRSAAFPFELAYRLISMFSIRDDTVLDPFSGTGTTLAAAMATGRHGIGIEIDGPLVDIGHRALLGAGDIANIHSRTRLLRHREFVRKRVMNTGPLKYRNRHYGFPVMTAQEKDILIPDVEKVVPAGSRGLRVTYSEGPQADLVGTWKAESVLKP